MIDFNQFPITKVLRGDPRVPQALWEIFSPPDMLFIQGSEKAWEILKWIPNQTLAIVGTRAPKFKTLQFMEKELARLQEKEFVILSGFALGIDRAAHALALRYKIPTIGVLAAGHDLDYPRENLDLRREILHSNGLLISEMPPGGRAHRSTFLRRNRLIAGWAKASWIVEAPKQSGALNTAYWSRKNGRDTYATAAFPLDPDFLGNTHLIRQDDGALPLFEIESFWQSWPGLRIGENRPRQKRTTTYLNPEQHLIEHFERETQIYGAVHLDNLLEWWRTQGWPLQDFFLCLDSAQKSGKISKERLLIYR